MNKLIIGFVVLVLIVSVGTSVLYYSTSERVQFTVTDKERVMTCNSTDSGSQCDAKYLVFTDVTTYTIEDSLIKMRFNSSDVYGRIKIGQECTATAYGWRVGFMSWYQNIFDVYCVDRN